MRFLYFSIVVLVITVLIGCQEEPTAQTAKSFYDTQLFKEVQLASLFKDSKTFVDLVPKSDYNTLEKAYLEARAQPNFDLGQFVGDHFMDKSMKSLEFETDTALTMYQHIAQMWDKLTRGPDAYVPNASRIALPYRYVVPGGRFQEIYYWDSYFTLEGLLAAQREDLAKNMVANFGFLLDSIGHIPNGTRDYYLTRSQPPFFSLMVAAVIWENPEELVMYTEQLAKEYAFFMAQDSLAVGIASQHVVPVQGGLLNRYYDAGDSPRPEAYKEDLHLAEGLVDTIAKKRLYKDLRSAAESGWDFSSRWYGKVGEFAATTTTSILPVDLNCLLYHLEKQLAQAYTLKGDEERAQQFKVLANQRQQLILQYFWDAERGYFMDYDFKKKRVTEALTLAGAFPLFFGIATPEQAAGVKEVLMTQFLKDGGLVTTLDHSGQQWDAPNGWAPLQWIAVKGLLQYGYTEEAELIMERWLHLNEKVFKNTGKMMEKYNVEDLTLLSGGGEYETQDGFGWTNGVALGFKQLLDEIQTTSTQ
ncbi:MAG: trehalase family glycosidase [Bacteroidota bacterium]